MSYEKYLESFNARCSEFKQTADGLIAKMDGVWYSVNGQLGDITDVRYPLNGIELAEYNVYNDFTLE